MSTARKKVLLKISGTLLGTDKATVATVRSIVNQIKDLSSQIQFGIVVGGGNFFRGAQQAHVRNMRLATSHQVGMLATVMNGLLLQEIAMQADLTTLLLTTGVGHDIGIPANQQTINNAIQQGHTIIFAGGTGNPFFTTDTNAVLRALQMDAAILWKATNVDGVYTTDPHTNSDAKFLPTVSYAQALKQQLAVMDMPAFALAQQHRLPIRIFNVSIDHALVRATHDTAFGSSVF